MAEEKRTTIIDFQIAEGDALSSLASTKKSILETKAAQKELNDEFKAGTKDVDTYAKETVQLEAQLKKQQASYSTLQRTVTGLKSPFDKLNESIKEQAKQVTVAGVSLSTFANPATATIGLLGGLFKAYASSTIGAKDLAFASNQLTFVFNELGNSLAKLVGSNGSGGFFSDLAGGLIGATVGPFAALRAKASARIAEELEDLGRKRLEIQAENNQRLKENIDIMEKLADSQVNFNEKQALGLKAAENLRINRDEILRISNNELVLLEKHLSSDKENEKLQTAIRLKKLEISEIENDTERSISKIQKLESNILDTNNKAAEAKNKQTEKEIEDAGKAREKQLEADRVYFDEINILQLEHDIGKAEGRQAEIDAEQAKHDALVEQMRASLKKSQELTKEKTETVKKATKEETRIDKLEQKARFDNSVAAFGALAGLFEQGTVAHKAATLTKLTLDTASAISSLTAASEANPANAFTFGGAGVLQFISGLIRIFANIAQASQLISAAAGGGSFMTKGPQLLMVGDNPGGVERVDVTPVSGRGKTVVGKNMVQMAGGGTMFTDASIVANSSQFSPSQQSVTVNMVYSEFREFQEQVLYKEQVAQA